jgi:hypothetical protein
MSSHQPLEIEIPVMRYDITLPLLEGRVPIDGVTLKPVKASSMINKEDAKLKSGDFGLMDLNIGYFLPAIEAGWQIVGLPVFSKRKPAYQLIFCHADAGIREPKELAGKRIGSRTYRTALTVWARGLLREHYSVDFSDVQSGFSVVYLRERMKQQTAAWGDPWKYGVKANKATIDAFVKYNVEQGMIRSAPSYADIFAAATLDT